MFEDKKDGIYHGEKEDDRFFSCNRERIFLFKKVYRSRI